MAFDVRNGVWHSVFRVAPGAQLPTHYHLGRVVGCTLRGRWHYRERDWEHRPGSYLLEVPGDSHTFEVIGEETVELFTVNEGASCCWTNAATSPALPMSCCAWSRLARITSVSGWAGPRSIRLSADRDRSQP